jgi:hypothetical protein
MAFDPYECWLGIPADRRPPTHYDLLGLAPFESDAETIEQASLRRMSKVRQHQIGPRGELSQEILAELARARLILLDPDRRADYDATLRAQPDVAAGLASVPEKNAKRDATTYQASPADESPNVFGSITLDEPARERLAGVRPATTRKPSLWKNPVAVGLFLASHCLLIAAFILYALPRIEHWRASTSVSNLKADQMAAPESGDPSAGPGTESKLRGHQAPAPSSARKFDGGTRITIAGSDDFDMTNGDYTIFALFKTEHGGTIFSKTAPAGGWVKDGKRLYIADGRLAFQIGGANTIATHERVDDNRWHCVALTYSHENHKVVLYIDGDAKNPQNLAPQGDPTGHVVRIGYTAFGVPNNQNCFVGWISAVRFYDRALTAAEIAGLASKTEPSGDLPVGQWTLRSRSGASIADESGHGHVGKLEVVPTSEPPLVKQSDRNQRDRAASAAPSANSRNRVPSAKDEDGKDRDVAANLARKPDRASNDPASVLKRFGLKLKGSLWVLEAEEQVQAKAAETRQLAEKLAYCRMQQQAALNPEQIAFQYEIAVNDYRSEIQLTDQAMKAIPRWRGQFYNIDAQARHSWLDAYKKQLDAELRQMTSSFNEMKRQGFDRISGDRARAAADEAQRDYDVALREFRQLVDETRKNIGDLSKSNDVKGALDALGKGAKQKPKLGSTPEHHANVQLLEQFEKRNRKPRR